MAEKVEPTSIHHIAFLVKDLDREIERFSQLLGRAPEQRGPVPYREAEVVMFQLDNVRIEIVAPVTEKSPLHDVIARQGEGFFHIGFGVTDLPAAVAALEDRGIEMKGPPHGGYKDWELVYLKRDSFPLFAAHLIANDAS